MNEAPLARVEELVASGPLTGGRPTARHGKIGAFLQRVLYRTLRAPLIQDHEWRIAVRDALVAQEAVLVAQEAVLAAQRAALSAADDEVMALRELMGRSNEHVRNEVDIVSRRVQWLSEKAERLGAGDSRGLDATPPD